MEYLKDMENFGVAFKEGHDLEKFIGKFLSWNERRVFNRISKRVNFLLTRINDQKLELIADGNSDKDEDDNWRLRESSGNLVIEKRVSDVWSEIIKIGSAGFIEGSKFKLTAIGGYAIALTNNTGVNSVEGQIVEADNIDENSYKKADANAIDPIGTVYNGGVADGLEVWIVIAGIAEVLLDAGGCVHHDRLITSATAGSADVSNTPAVGVHFREIGHALETVVGAGLAKTVLHFL